MYNTVSAGAANLITMQGIRCNDSRKTTDKKQAGNKRVARALLQMRRLIPSVGMGQASKKKGSKM
jgi:hypothetical protein